MILLLVLMVISGDANDFIPTCPMIEEVNHFEYIVGPGDILWFSVQSGIPAELSGNEAQAIFYMTVTPDGFAVIPSAGAWFVSGLRLCDATDLIEAGFAAKYPGLRGLAGLAIIRTFRVPVTGHVSRQGIFDITGASRLSDLLEEAGGIASSGSWTSIKIIHSNGDTTEIDITGFLLEGLIQSNPIISLGDRVHVPEAEEFVMVEGAVNVSCSFATSYACSSEVTAWNGSSSGKLEYIPGETVSVLILRMGGTMPWASRSDCYIERTLPDGRAERIMAPLDNPEIDPLLLPGDRVVCPGIPPVVAVSGFVYSPGVYPHIADMGAFYYTSQAGGLLREASESGIRVVLNDGTELKPDEIPAIPAGATITVPRQNFVGWQDPLLVLTGIASVIIAWKSVF